MARDYKPRNRRKKKKSLPGYAWLLSGLAIGLFIALIIYLDKQPESNKDFGTAVQEEIEKIKHTNEKNNASKDTSAEKSAAVKVINQDKKEEKFKFYKLLPKLEVFIPESETRPPKVKSKDRPSKPTEDSEGKQYVLQVGSFQNLADAEKLKANLAFLGLEASIQHVTIKNKLWHRVRFGPYQDKQQLYRNQNLLKKNDINSNSMELK